MKSQSPTDESRQQPIRICKWAIPCHGRLLLRIYWVWPPTGHEISSSHGRGEGQHCTTCIMNPLWYQTHHQLSGTLGHQQSKSLAENAVKQMKALLKKSKEQMDRWRRPLPNSPRFEEHPKRQDTRITSPRPDVQTCHWETSPWHQLFWNRKSVNQQQYQMRKIQIRKYLALCLYEVRWQPGLHWPTLHSFFSFFLFLEKPPWAYNKKQEKEHTPPS